MFHVKRNRHGTGHHQERRPAQSGGVPCPSDRWHFDTDYFRCALLNRPLRRRVFHLQEENALF